MIQRIQSLYLFAVCVLQTILLFSLLATVFDTSGTEISIGITEITTLAVLTSVTALASFASIFLYRKRVLQARCNVFNLIILLALQGFVIYYLVGLSKQYETVVYSIPDAFPLVSAVLSYLAIRGILKDEFLMRALNRLR
jgi:hypothetical protein